MSRRVIQNIKVGFTLRGPPCMLTASLTGNYCVDLYRREAFMKNLEIVRNFTAEARRGRRNFTIKLNDLSDLVCMETM